MLKFNNFHKQLPVPFIIYADFEAITKKVQGCRPNDNKSYTEAYQAHDEDCGYGYKVLLYTKQNMDRMLKFDWLRAGPYACVRTGVWTG